MALACAAVPLGLALLAWYGAQAPGSQVFGRSVVRGPGRRRSLALTFDDGPSPGSLAIAAYLAREGIRATFFQCGANVVRHPEIARALREAGHELGNHTFTHRRLCPRLGWRLNLRSVEEICDEFAATQAAIVAATGFVPQLARAPYGLRWVGMRVAQRRLGLLGVLWTVIAHDWEWDEERVAEHVLRHASPGGIVCLHDGRDTRVGPDITVTLGALRRVVPVLQERGYRFETVSELLQAGEAEG